MKIISSLVTLSALVAAASAQQQQVPVTQAPVTPAPTTQTKLAVTPAATQPMNFFSVSVERDATYSIAGPICSGSGATPAGKNCPKKGDVAIDRCLPYLQSYTLSGKCFAPIDAECKVIHTGAWGCVWSSGSASNSTSGSASNSTSGGSGQDRQATQLPTTKAPGSTTNAPVSTTKAPIPAPIPTRTNGTSGGNKTSNSTAPPKVGNDTIQTPTKLTNLAVVGAASNSAAVTVGTVAAVAAVAAVAIGAVIYKKNQNKATTEATMSNMFVDVVTP